jgi:membrane protease YdiL (CAAX protease family)
MSIQVSLNSYPSVRSRMESAKIFRIAPFLTVFARPIFALLAQGFFVFLFTALGVFSPAVQVRNWWTVYGTLVDLGCLGLLAWLVRREGIRIFDLISFRKDRLKRDFLIGLGIFILVFPITVFGGSMLAGSIAYGSLQPTLPEGGFMRMLPLAAVLYSRIIWWPIWSFTEELTFQGYCLPRLQVLTKHTWIAVGLVSFGWSLQHSFLPWINPQHGLFLFLMFLPLTITLQLIYLRVRRLPPLIIGHWLMDLASVLFMLHVV